MMDPEKAAKKTASGRAKPSKTATLSAKTSNPRKKNKGGAGNKRIFTPKELGEIQGMAVSGMPHRLIAAKMRTSLTRLYDQARAELDYGEAHGAAEFFATFSQRSLTEIPLMIFRAKTQFGLTEKQVLHHQGPDDEDGNPNAIRIEVVKTSKGNPGE